jgi:hypothetical protein
MLCHHGFTPSVGDHYADVFSFVGIVGWCFEVEVPRVFLLFVCVFGILRVILGLLVSPL